MAVVKELEILTMSVSPMKDDFTLDEAGLRAHLRRLIAARNGYYLGSGGCGEGHSLTPKELRRVYEIGVEEGKGKVPVYANPRESRTAQAMLEVAQEAVAAGVDMVQLYQLDGGHGLVPTPREQEAYFNYICEKINHPISFSMHGQAGYLASPALLKTLTSRFPQVQAINVMGPPDRYFQQLRDTLPDTVRLYTGIGGLPTLAAMGAVGALQAQGNIVPNICRRVGDAIVSGDRETLATNLTALKKLDNAVSEVIPQGGTARSMKMSLKALGLGNGNIRPPYLQIPAEDVKRLRAGFDAIGVAKLEGIEEAVAA